MIAGGCDRRSQSSAGHETTSKLRKGGHGGLVTESDARTLKAAAGPPERASGRTGLHPRRKLAGGALAGAPSNPT